MRYQHRYVSGDLIAQHCQKFIDTDLHFNMIKSFIAGKLTFHRRFHRREIQGRPKNPEDCHQIQGAYSGSL